MKVIVLGCTHAGTAAIMNIVKLHKDAKITVYEKNDNISFLSCGIALHVAGVVKDPAGLFYCSPAILVNNGVDAKMQHEVLSVDAKKKSVRVKNMLTGAEFDDAFDKLVVTSGSWPVIPPIPGIDLKNVLLSKNFEHSQAIIERAQVSRSVVVVGGGYIGVELAEAFREMGKDVTLIDAAPCMLNRYLDEDFTQITEKTMRDHGIKLAFDQSVSAFQGENGTVSEVVTSKGSYKADMVVLCVGFKPNTDFLKGQIDMLPNGAIIVDDYMHTTMPDILAAGDSCAVRFNPIDNPAYIPLATNAVRMGTLVAYNLKKKTLKSMGTQGTSAIKIYDQNISSTGLTAAAAKEYKLDVKETVIDEDYRPAFMPTHERLRLKLVYETKSHKIVGAQIISRANVTEAMNVISVVIQSNMTVEQLAFTDFYFLPHYDNPWHYLNSAALAAMATF